MEKLEKSVLGACGDRVLARRVRREAEKGTLSGGRALRNLEKAVAKRCGDTRFARKFRVTVEGEALQVVPQAAPTKLGLKTLIAKNVVGWAREPGTNLAVLVTAGKGCLVHDDNGKRITDPSFQFHNKFPAPVSKADFRAHAETLGPGEGVIPWLYQDGKHNVIVGIGHLIRDAAEARRIGAQYFFFNRGIHGRIDAQAVVDAFHAVKNAKGATPGKASTYEDISEVRMESQAMVDLFDDDVDTKLKEIRAIKQFRYYSSYPPGAKLGVLDLAFNAGVHNIIPGPNTKGFPKFLDAVQHRDWAIAAAESDRGDPKRARNVQVRTWFLQAAKREPFFLRAPTRRPCSVMLKDLLK